MISTIEFNNEWLRFFVKICFIIFFIVFFSFQPLQHIYYAIFLLFQAKKTTFFVKSFANESINLFIFFENVSKVFIDIIFDFR